MLSYIKDNTNVVLDFDGYYIQEEWFGADDTLCFSLPKGHPQSKDMVPQLNLIDKESGQSYLITAVDDKKDTEIKAEIDLDELKREMFIPYTNNSDTLSGTLQGVLPNNWSVMDYTASIIRRTIELEAATPLDVIKEIPDIYNVAVRFDNNKKQVLIYNPDNIQPTGAYLSEELNLKSNPTYTSKTEGFATRLYCYGEENMTFADINDGKPYVENHTYSDRIISAYWKDERYKDKESLLSAGQAKIDAISIPTQSYQCDMIDLARVDKEQWGQLTISMYAGIVLMDNIRKSRVIHRVAQYRRYPHQPTQNEVTLSTVPGKITSKVQQTFNAVENPNSSFRQGQQIAIDNATNWIVNGKGYMVAVKDESGNWKELCSLDVPDIQQATKVWRWNNGGFGFSDKGYNGPYKIAITQDGAIVADFITTGILTANIIKAGVLESLNGASKINMETGDCNMSGIFTAVNDFLGGCTFSLNGSGVEIRQKHENTDTLLGGMSVFVYEGQTLGFILNRGQNFQVYRPSDGTIMGGLWLNGNICELGCDRIVADENVSVGGNLNAEGEVHSGNGLWAHGQFSAESDMWIHGKHAVWTNITVEGQSIPVLTYN